MSFSYFEQILSGGTWNPSQLTNIYPPLDGGKIEIDTHDDDDVVMGVYDAAEEVDDDVADVDMDVGTEGNDNEDADEDVDMDAEEATEVADAATDATDEAADVADEDVEMGTEDVDMDAEEAADVEDAATDVADEDVEMGTENAADVDMIGGESDASSDTYKYGEDNAMDISWGEQIWAPRDSPDEIDGAIWEKKTTQQDAEVVGGLYALVREISKI